MKRIQLMRCGATRDIRYCLTLIGASLILVFAVACSSEDSRPATQDLKANAVDVDVDVDVEPADTASLSGNPSKNAQEDNRSSIVFLGTSLTAGYGLREDQAFPALIEARMRAAGFDYRVINAGVSGDTSAGGLRRLDWLLRLPISILVLELGANDMLRGLSVEALKENLDEIVMRTKAAFPDVRFLIAGMRAAPNLGSDYRDAFDAVYPELAARHHARLVPFLLEDVAAKRNLNQADGIHPTAEGHRLIAERLWSEIVPILQKN